MTTLTPDEIEAMKALGRQISQQRMERRKADCLADIDLLIRRLHSMRNRVADNPAKNIARALGEINGDARLLARIYGDESLEEWVNSESCPECEGEGTVEVCGPYGFYEAPCGECHS